MENHMRPFYYLDVDANAAPKRTPRTENEFIGSIID